jgi:hypothetical protein
MPVTRIRFAKKKERERRRRRNKEMNVTGSLGRFRCFCSVKI